MVLYVFVFFFGAWGEVTKERKGYHHHFGIHDLDT